MNNSVGSIKFDASIDTQAIKKDAKEVEGTIKGFEGQAGASFGKLGTMAKVGMAAAAAAVVAGFGLMIKEGFDFNTQVENATAKINAFTKSSQKTGEILSYVKNESIKTQFGFGEMADAAAALIPASKSSGVALEQLIKQAEILAALQPEQGLTGAAFSLKEALSGDFVSIVERFNLPRQRLNQLKADGVPALEAVSKALEEMGIDYSLVEKQGQTTEARWNTMKDTLNQLAGAATKPLFDQISSGLKTISDWYTANKPAIDDIVKKFGTELANGAKIFGDALGWMWQQFKPVFDEITANKPLLEFLGIFFKALAVIVGVTLVAAFGLVLAAVTLVIGVFEALRRVGVWLGDTAWSLAGIFIRTWNSIVSVWSGAAGWFTNVGRNIASGLVNGISAGKDAVINKIKEIASGALDTIKKFFGIHSPSKVMAQMGTYMMQGWSIGMDKSSSMAIGSAQRASSGVLGTFDNLTSPTLGIDGSGSLSGSVGSRTANITNNYVVNNQADAEIISKQQAYAMGAV